MPSLLEIARKFVNERFMSCNDVLGVLLEGSAAIGVRDEFVDLDFEVIIKEKRYKEGVFLADETVYDGVDVCWGWISLEKLESKLSGWQNDINLWVYSTSKIMYDPTGKVEDLLKKYKRYPEDIRREKMFSYCYYGWAEAPYNFEKALLRKDPITAQFCLTNAVEIFTALLFIINHNFVPYRKWRLRELQKLKKKPEKYEEKVKQLVQTNSFSSEAFNLKRKKVHEVVDKLRELVIQEGVPSENVGNDMWKYEPKYQPSV
ncbi:MAG: DUF4037 domain-containing protein [Candidatus Bathyarchaeales archaeon]